MEVLAAVTIVTTATNLRVRIKMLSVFHFYGPAIFQMRKQK